MGAALALRDGADVAPGHLEAEGRRLLRSGSSDGPAHGPPGPVRARASWADRDDLGRHSGPGPASTRGARARRGGDPVAAALERVRGIVVRGKVAEGKLSSSKSRERWGNVLTRLIPVFGRLRVDELRTADVVVWRDQVARWIRDGMPSTRKRDEGKQKIVKLSPVTANGWLSILKVICAAMTKHYELARDPAKPVEYFPAPRTYTREQPNALTAAQIPIFAAKMKELYPQHYAMVLLGFGIGARPSTLRPRSVPFAGRGPRATSFGTRPSCSCADRTPPATRSSTRRRRSSTRTSRSRRH